MKSMEIVLYLKLNNIDMSKLKKNFFLDSISRNFKELKSTIARDLSEDLELEYKRKIEDLVKDHRKQERAFESLLLDITPVNSSSVRIVPSNFDAKEIMSKDMEIGSKIQNIKEELLIAVIRYEHLFGPVPDENTIKAILPNWTPATYEN